MSHRILALALLVAVVLLVVGCAGTRPERDTPSATAVASRATVAPSSAPTGSPPSAPTGSLPPSTAGPVVEWDFGGEGLGTPPDDLELVGGFELADGGLLLDGGTAYGETRGPGPLDTAASFTVAAWVRPDEILPFAGVVSQTGKTTAAFSLGMSADEWVFEMKDQDTDEPYHTVRATGGAPTIDRATWTHLAGVFDAVAGELTLYVDGRAVASAAFAEPWLAAGPLKIGGSLDHGRPSDHWPGAIGHVVAYQRALSGQEIGEVQAATRPGVEPPDWSGDAAALAALRGTWDSRLTEAEVEYVASLFSPSEVAETGIRHATTHLRFGFDGRRYWQGFVFDDQLWLVHGVPEGDGGVMAIDGDELTTSNGRDGWATYRWSIDRKALTLTLLRCVEQDEVRECPDVDIVRFMSERTFRRSGDDPSF